MASDHQNVSSEDGDDRSPNSLGAVGGDDQAVSSEQAPVLAVGGKTLIEDGFDVAAHGGGRLEDVEGFMPHRAMTEGFGSVSVALDEALEALPRNCDLEFGEPESVCGNDDRVQVIKTANVPWRMICQLVITRHDDVKSRCTGWFIGPRTVMTAGHCVYSHTAGGWAKSIEVVPGMNGSERPFGAATGTSFRSVSGWTTDKKPDHDYGAIILPDNSLGNTVGHFGFASLTDAELDNLLVNNSGYPGDKPFGTQWFNAGRVTKVTARRLFYMIDTYGGSSGSPVWRASGEKRHAVGIHAYGGCPNKATRITQSVFKNMKKWKDLAS